MLASREVDNPSPIPTIVYRRSDDEVPRDVVEKLFVSARGEPYIKYRKALNMVYDVSTWKPGEDVVEFYAWRREYDTLVMTSFDTGDTILYEIRELSHRESFYSSTLFLYPWKGEDTIFYELFSWALTVNGRQVGSVVRPFCQDTFGVKEV